MTGTLPHWWPVLFPLSYLAHIAEEYWCGERFYNWASRVTGFQYTAESFLEINTVAWIAMLLASLMAIWVEWARWITISLASAVLLNGIAHLVASLITTSYSPGLITGLLFWAPLGAVTLLRTWRSVAKPLFAGAVVFGVFLHALVTFAALSRESLGRA